MTKRWIVGGALSVAVLLVVSTSVPGQTGYKAPRTGDGKPNFNGIWQAMTTGHWDVEAHPAAPGRAGQSRINLKRWRKRRRTSPTG